MNILFVTLFKVDANKGGVRRVTEALAQEFLEQGFGVYYLALTSGTDEMINGVQQRYIPNGISVTSDENITFIRQLLKDQNIDFVINQAGIYPEPMKVLERSVAGGAAKLLSVHHNCIVCLIKNYRNILASSYGNSFLFQFLDNAPVLGLLKAYNKVKYGIYFRRAIERSDKFILLSDSFIPELGVYTKRIDSSKVMGIPNPAPFSVAVGVESKKENRLLFVGRLNVSQKRVDLLIDVWGRLFKKYPEWSFDVVGDGPEMNTLVRRAAEVGLERILFHGFKDPRPYLERAKLFCMTSAFEGYPMVLVEAQAYGVIPFAFNTFSSIQDIIQSGESGVVVKPFDIDEYTKQLERLMTDNPRRKQMAANAQHSVQRYHVSSVVKLWIRVFEVLKNKPGVV